MIRYLLMLNAEFLPYPIKREYLYAEETQVYLYMTLVWVFCLCSFSYSFLLISSLVCSATTTMPQCAAPTIRTTRTSVSCAEMPASNSLKYLLCQKVPVLLVCTYYGAYAIARTRLHRHLGVLTGNMSLSRMEVSLKQSSVIKQIQSYNDI